VAETGEFARVTGRVEGVPGPLLLCVGGIHGNEPAGLHAQRRVLTGLAEDRIPVRGTLICLAGNLGALRKRARYRDADLNRIWSRTRVALVQRDGTAGARQVSAGLGAGPVAEELEQKALLDEIRPALEAAAGRLAYFLDLHTSSADGEPFVCIGDTLRNRAFASNFPAPVILGLEEQVDGALLEFLNDLGLVTIGVEGGQHEAPHSIDRHEAALWIALAAAGLIEEHPRVAAARALLECARPEISAFVEIRYRHAIRPEDNFRMQPGFRNFGRVGKSELLAVDVKGEVLALRAGRVLLPLYQGLGDDGFFLAREVRPFWLWVSRVLRRLRCGGIVHWLPGVRRDPDNPDARLVDARVARWSTIEVFHLLGFRRKRSDGKFLRVRRRRHDLRAPQRYWPPA